SSARTMKITRRTQDARDRLGRPSSWIRGSSVSWSAGRSCVIAAQIWVSYAQTSKDRAFLGFHLLRLRLDLVIVAHQMQHAMGDQVAEMIRKGLALRHRLGGADAVCQDHIAHMRPGRLGRRKRQDIRRTIPPAK